MPASPRFTPRAAASVWQRLLYLFLSVGLLAGGGALLMVVLLLSGCGSLLTPATPRPAAGVPPVWPRGQTDAASAQEADAVAVDSGWRSFILDAHLQALIEQALANNRSLRIAALNIEKARAQYGISRANLFPALNAVGDATHSRRAGDLRAADEARISHGYAANLGFSSYELDLFGKLRQQRDGAQELWLESVEARNAAQISLIAEVAGAYLSLAASQQQLQLARDTLASQQDTLRLVQRQFDAGQVSLLDVRAAQASLDSLQAEVARADTAQAQAENALALLLGSPLPPTLRPPPALLDGRPVLREVAAGLSSAQLLRRPDLRADEHALKAANANIGAARAAFFPAITLTASAGSASNEMQRLFAAGNGSWNFVPQISLPIFNAGALQSALDLAHATRDIQLASYEKDIQTAFQEVANALAQRSNLGAQLRAQQAQCDASADSYRLAQVRYRYGLDSYLSLLVYQRTLYAAQQSLITSRLAQQSNRIALFKALGGGSTNRGQPD